MSRKIRCGATIAFGDDYGDNSTTFHCQLWKGHKHHHIEKESLGGQKFRLYWEGDARVDTARFELESCLPILHCRHKYKSVEYGERYCRECSECGIVDFLLPKVRKDVRNARRLLKRLEIP